MDTTFLNKIFLTISLFLLLTLFVDAQNTPYDVRWYEVSTDGTFAGNSDDSLATQKAIRSYFQSEIADITTQWTDDTYGIYYLNRVGIGANSDRNYRLFIHSFDGWGIYQTADGLTPITNRAKIGATYWHTVYSETEYMVGTSNISNYPFKILHTAATNTLTVNDVGVGVKKLSATEALDVTGNVKLSGVIYAAGLSTLTNTNILTYNASGLFGKQNIYTIISDSLFWRYNAGNILLKSEYDYVGIGTQTPSYKLHVYDIADTYISTTADGSTGVAGFAFNNDDITWKTRIRGDYANRYEIYDETNVRIPFHISAVDGQVNVAYDLNVGDSVTAPNLPEQVTPNRIITSDVNGNFGYTTSISPGGGIIENDTLSDGFGIRKFSYDGSVKDTVSVDTNQIATTNYVNTIVGDSSYWHLGSDTTIGDYMVGDYNNGDYLLAYYDDNCLINEDSYNVKTTNNLTVTEDLNVKNNIMENNVDVSRWRGVLNAPPTSDVQDGDLYYNEVTEKVYIRAKLSWKQLN